MSHGRWCGLNNTFDIMKFFEIRTINSKYVLVCDFFCSAYLVTHITTISLLTILSYHSMYAFTKKHPIPGFFIAPNLVIFLDLSFLHIFQGPIRFTQSLFLGKLYPL